MDGVAAVLSVLQADAALLVLVPALNIRSGSLPLKTQLPAISLQGMGKNDLNIPKPGATRFVSQRVSVNVSAKNYVQREAILRAVRHAAADQLYPTVAGISGVTIHTAGSGPDIENDDASVWWGSQYFMVKYTETR